MIVSGGVVAICMGVYLMVLVGKQRVHFFMCLLLLEGVMLMMLISMILVCGEENGFYSMILLSFGVCEASVGLALLVRMTRFCGSDHLKLFVLNKC